MLLSVVAAWMCSCLRAMARVFSRAASLSCVCVLHLDFLPGLEDLHFKQFVPLCGSQSLSGVHPPLELQRMLGPWQ